MQRHPRAARECFDGGPAVTAERTKNRAMLAASKRGKDPSMVRARNGSARQMTIAPRTGPACCLATPLARRAP